MIDCSCRKGHKLWMFTTVAPRKLLHTSKKNPSREYRQITFIGYRNEAYMFSLQFVVFLNQC